MIQTDTLWRRIRHALICALLLGAFAYHFARAQTQSTDSMDQALSLLDRWLERRASATTLKGEFLHVTRLRAFKKEIRRKGILWAAGADLLKCELRNDQGQLLTTLIRNKTGNYIIDEDRKEYESTADTDDAPVSFYALTAFVGRSDLRRLFSIVSWNRAGNNVVYHMRPTDPSDNKIKTFTLTLADVEPPLFRSCELTFADGSRVRTEALKSALNVQIDSRLFYPDLTGLKRRAPTPGASL